MRLSKKLSFGLITTLCAFTVWMILNMIAIRNYSKNCYYDKSDVALVLGARTTNGQLSPVFKERANHAIYLYKTGRVKYILFTGGRGKGQLLSDSKAAQNYAMYKGVNENDILIEELSTITYFNVLNAKKIMDRLNLKSALLVSDPYHMLRAHKMCKKLGIMELPSPTPTSMYKSRHTKWKFLPSEGLNLMSYQIFERFRKTQ